MKNKKFLIIAASILASLVLLAILAVVLINNSFNSAAQSEQLTPESLQELSDKLFESAASKINAANDSKRREDVRAILGAIKLYKEDNDGSLPSGIPTLIAEQVVVNSGIEADKIEGLVPSYLTAIPTDPYGSSYGVGIFDGKVFVGAVLSDGELYTVSE